MDGYLKIKTKLDNSNIDKGITELEDKIKKIETDNSNLSTEQRGLEEELNKYEKLQQEADIYKQKIKDLEIQRKNLFVNGALPSSQLPTYQSVISEIEQAKNEQIRLNNEIDKQAPKIERIHNNLNKIKIKQNENNTKIQQFRQKIEQINLNKVQKGIDNVGNSIQKSIGRLGKMSMAVIGIRTAFSAVRQAMNTVSQYNPQIAADFEYMRYCISNLLAPAIQGLIKLLYTALSYINAIASAWFGINIFGNASVKNFQKMQKSAGGTAKSAKEIQKSLQGFDEMNILQDSSNDSSSGGSGASTPSIDLSDMQGEVPNWLKWIIDNKDLILSTIAGIVAGVLGFKMLNLAATLGLIENHLLGIKAIGIGVMIAGIILLVQSVISYLNDPSWVNFGKIIISIGVALLGLALIIGSVPLAIGAAIAIIIGLIVSNWEKIKQFLQNGIDWLNSKVDWVRDNFGLLGEAVYKIFTAILQELLNIFDDVFKGIKTILDGLIKVFKGIFTGDMKTVLEGFKQIFIGIFDSIWGVVKGILNLIIRGINTLIRGANKISFDIPDWVPGLGGKKFGINIQQIPLLAKGGVISQPTQAIIGEAGKEAVVPLENNLEWLDILATKIANKIDAGGGSFIINMDSRTIQRGIAKRQQELAFARNGR